VSNVGAQVNGSFLEEEVLNGLVALAHGHVHASFLRLCEIDKLVGTLESVDSLLEFGEKSVNLVDGGVVVIVSVGHNFLAKVANEVGLGEEIVDTASASEGGEACNKGGFHLLSNNY